MARRTPLFDRHVALGARMVEFGGYDMPLQYSGMRAEHEAVRQRAGLFDLSHMGEVQFTGDEGVAAVQRLVANDVSRLDVGGALYGVMCREDGGIVDDVVVYRDQAGCMVVVNAGTRDRDVEWMRARVSVPVDDLSDAASLLAVQGPRALAIVQRLTDVTLGDIPSFHSVYARVAGEWARVSRTGYTGEDGVELYVLNDVAGALWDALLEVGTAQGLLPCGLGARDTLRLEAGLRLYGQDMDETVDPYSCGLGWTVKLNGNDFIGAPALRAIHERGGPAHRLVGLAMDGRSIARHGHPVSLNGRQVGVVTSGTHSFTLGHGIATASVAAADAGAETFDVNVRGTTAAARRVPLPFYRRKQ